MAKFKFNITESTFNVEQLPNVVTDCATIFNFKVTATSGNDIRISLDNTYTDFNNSFYKVLGVETPWDGSDVTITYGTDLYFSFSLGNSGTPGAFLKTIVEVWDDTTADSYNFYTLTVTRLNDNLPCDDPTGKGSTYDELSDTPNSKIGNALKYIRVSADELTHEYVDLAPGGSTDYISNTVLTGTDLVFTGVGSAFTGSVPLAGILGSTDYVSNVSLPGTDLIFTGIGSAFAGSVDLSKFGLLAGDNDWTGTNTWETSSGITGTFNNLGTGGSNLALGIQATGSGDGAFSIHNGGGATYRALSTGTGNLFEGNNATGRVITIDNNGNIEAPSINIGGPGTNVMLDDGTVTPLSGLGGGSTDYVSNVSLNAGFDILNFTGIGSAFNSNVDMSEYVTKSTIQTITGLKTFTHNASGGGIIVNTTEPFTGGIIVNSSAANSQGIVIANSAASQGIIIGNSSNGQGIFLTNSSSGTGIDLYNNSSGKAMIIHAGVGSTGTPFSIRDDGSETFSINKEGDIIANSIDIGGAGTEVLLDDGTTTPLKPYVSYVALVSQTGTSNPTAIVLENNLGGTVTFVRGAVGLYTANLTGAFTLDKVAIFLTNSADNIMSGNYFSTDAVGIQTSDRNGNLADNLFNKTSVEIRVYS